MKEMEGCIYCRFFRTTKTKYNGIPRGACDKKHRMTAGDFWCKNFREKIIEIHNND